MVQSWLYNCIFIYLLIIDLKNDNKRSPDGQPYCRFSVARCCFQLPVVVFQLPVVVFSCPLLFSVARCCFQLPEAIGRLLSSKCDVDDNFLCVSRKMRRTQRLPKPI